MDIYKTASQLRCALETGEVGSEEWVKQLIQRVDSFDSEINSHLGLDAESALEQARAADQRRANGETLGPLDGIPISLKNNMAIKGQKLTCGSHILENFESPYDATVVEKLKAAGAIIFGRLNMDEFAMGSSNETSYFGATRNPWDTDRTPGGSSGGSAAAVAAGFCPISLGSDTGGSIRQPAAYCGVYGLKPTYGRVSRYGLVAFASSLDQIGPLAREVNDLAEVLSIISGHDKKDSSSYPVTSQLNSYELEAVKRKPVIGVPKQYKANVYGARIHRSIFEKVQSVIEFYESQGCEIRDISLDHDDLALSTYYLIATAEASSNLARFDGIRYTHRSKDAKDLMEVYFKSRGEGFGEEVKRRIILGTFALSSGYHDAYYLKAQQVRTLIRNDYNKVFESGVDLILTPTAPSGAFLIGENADPLEMYLNDIFTIPANLTGLPAVSVPCGFSFDLPIGFQLIAPHFKEMSLLQAAKLYENGNEAHLARPPLGN